MSTYMYFHGGFQDLKKKIRFSKEFMSPNNCPQEGKCKRNCTCADPRRNLQIRMEGAIGDACLLPPFLEMPIFKTGTYMKYYYFGGIKTKTYCSRKWKTVPIKQTNKKKTNNDGKIKGAQTNWKLQTTRTRIIWATK